MKLYALKHRRTGNLMPELKKGYTHWEPTIKYNAPPRLFVTATGARRAATYWAKGTARIVYRHHTSFLDMGDVEPCIEYDDKGRDSDDLVAVPVILTFDDLGT